MFSNSREAISWRSLDIACLGGLVIESYPTMKEEFITKESVRERHKLLCYWMEDCGELGFVAVRTIGICEFEEKDKLLKFDKLWGLLD